MNTFLFVESPNTTHPAAFSVHREAERYVVKSTQQVVAWIARRDEYPTTFCHPLEDGSILLGYGAEAHSEDDEYLFIKIAVNGSVSIRRDLRGTLPLFYGHEGFTFVVSNQYSTVWDALPKKTINHAAIVETLIPTGMRNQTLCEQIRLVYPDEEVHYQHGSVTVQATSVRDWSHSRAAPTTEPRDFIRLLNTHMEAFVADHEAKFNTAAFEVSGGLDSSLLPLFLKQYHPGTITTFSSMIYQGSFGNSQAKKLATFVPKEAHHITTPLVKDFSPAKRFSTHKPFYCLEEIYEPNSIHLAEQLQAQGIRFLFTGIGGDDIMENNLSPEAQMEYGEETRRKRLEESLPPFYTSAFRASRISTVPAKPRRSLPKLPISIGETTFAGNNTYIERGIWPISPFISGELYAICQGLPAHFRDNKNIIRLYYQANSWPSEIYDTLQNEHFGTYFDELFMQGNFDEVVKHYTHHSQLASMEFVDTKVLYETFQGCCAQGGNSTSRNRLFFLLFMWLNVEHNLAQFSGDDS